jgi:hypothetical protein
VLTLPAALSLVLAPAAPLPARVVAADTARYFQQDIRYTVRAALDEPSGVLVAAGRLVYRNNSPDTLRDLYFHLYLNAFRPGSLWSADETREGIQRFADLAEPFSAFEHLQHVVVGRQDLAVDYPNTPDSTIAHVRLPVALAPGDSLEAALGWEARPSVVPRRQGRQGRRFDFAQWYPKVCVYDRHGWEAHPLRLAGELYGEYGTYDVTLDLAEDQVVAATGVPVAGDPGWSRAAGGAAVDLQAGWYGARSRPGVMDWQDGLQPGRRRVRFYAEQIHHFAWSVNPQYRYEEGREGDIALRTLFLPQDSATWGRGLVIGRLQRAMRWLQEIYGPYPYPQTIAIHRIEGGGTEFPMLVMNGGPGEGLIFHEVGHLYTYGILGNNEWKDGWQDEGFTSFQTAWYGQRQRPGAGGRGLQSFILGLDLDGWSEPIATVAEDFADFSIYNLMIYNKGQLFLEMLRDQLGEDTFRAGLHLYYQRWKLKHVDEDALRTAMEDASRRDLRGFFGEWLHATPLVDYGLSRVRRSRQADGSWLTRFTVRRLGSGVMPVPIAVPVGDSTILLRAEGRAAEEPFALVTPQRTGRIELDPARVTMDWNYTNNRESGPRVRNRIGWSGSAPSERDAVVANWLPLAWYNDAGGATFGLQLRTNYLGRFDQNVIQVTEAVHRGRNDITNVFVAMRNPTGARAPHLRWGMEGFFVEGRTGGRLWATFDKSAHYGYGPRVTLGIELGAMHVRNDAYVDSARWSGGTTFEATHALTAQWNGPGVQTRLQFTATAGAGFGVTDLSSVITTLPLPVGGVSPGPTADPVYGRGSFELVHRRALGALRLGVRAFGGFIASNGAYPLQRHYSLAGADPYQTFANPFLRSRGALLARPDVHYTAPGGAGLRGLDPSLAAKNVAAANLELALPLVRAPARRIFSILSLAAFGDVAAANGTGYCDAGLGVRATHRVGPTTFTTRADLPFVVCDASRAVGAQAGDGRVRLRMVWSLEEAF